MFNSTTVARPYAKAAFEYACEQTQIDLWLSMLGFATTVSQDKALIKVMSSDIKAEKLADLFINIAGVNLDQAGQAFIRILANNKRLKLLPEIYELFNLYRAEYLSIKEIDVITADELNSAQLDKISKAMQQRLSCKVKLNCSIDKSILAGIIIRTGDMVIDGSISGRLERLTDKLLA